MKSFILKLAVINLSIIAALTIFIDRGRARGTQTAVSAPQEKTVEQVQKNIKVLTGLPQSQLIPVMNFFAASLGRRCNFCHVNKNGQWDYVSDEKPEKGTAREMIKMVLDVNKTTFKGSVEVSCYTCHRGRNQPQSIPILPLPLPSPPPGNPAGAGGQSASASAIPPSGQPQASPSPAAALPSAEDVFSKYIAALGGQQAIDKLKSRVATGTIVQANGNTLQFELYQVAPDKFYQLVTTPQGPFERGFNGTVGWEKSARGVRELTEGELAQVRANNLFSLIKLKEQLTRARVSGKEKIGDREAYVVNGSTVDGKRQRLFFDVETGLLLRRITFTTTMIGVIPEQADFEDYREVDGIKIPFTARSSTIETGNPVSTRKFTEIKLNATVDESKFNMPPTPKPATP